MLIQVAVLLYGLAAFAVVGAAERCARDRRPYPETLTLAGWSVMSFSATLCVLLLTYAAYVMAMGVAPAPVFVG